MASIEDVQCDVRYKVTTDGGVGVGRMETDHIWPNFENHRDLSCIRDRQSLLKNNTHT